METSATPPCPCHCGDSKDEGNLLSVWLTTSKKGSDVLSDSAGRFFHLDLWYTWRSLVEGGLTGGLCSDWNRQVLGEWQRTTHVCNPRAAPW